MPSWPSLRPVRSVMRPRLVRVRRRPAAVASVAGSSVSLGNVLGVPHPPCQVDAVLFDFHGTLAQVEDAVTWVVAAAAACGSELDRGRATVLADQLVTAGRAGGPVPQR